jgi:hypothetical protein
MKDLGGIKYYSPIEEKINTISHAIGFILSIVANVTVINFLFSWTRFILWRFKEMRTFAHYLFLKLLI